MAAFLPPALIVIGMLKKPLPHTVLGASLASFEWKEHEKKQSLMSFLIVHCVPWQQRLKLDFLTSLEETGRQVLDFFVMLNGLLLEFRAVARKLFSAKVSSSVVLLH